MSAGAEPTARTGRTPLRPSILAALALVRRHALGWLVVMVAAQGVLALVVLPALDLLFRGFLVVAGVDGINQASIGVILASPAALLVLVLYAAVATLLITAELALFAAVATALFDGAPLSVRVVVRSLGRVVRRLVTWQSPLLMLYVLLVLPLSHFALGSTLTSHIAIPRFISGELVKTTAGSIVYVVVIAAIAYAAFRLLPTLAALVGDDASVVRSMRRALALTRPVQARLALTLVATAAVVTVAVAAVATVGLAVVVVVPGSSSGPTAAVILTLVETARFVAVGFATAFLASLFVAMRRADHGDGVGIPEVAPAARRTRSVAGVLLGVAVLAVAAQALVAVAGWRPTGTAAEVAVVAHRGYAAEAVENSLEALEAAAANGADMVELDIQETADGGFVVIHDTDLGRLAGIDAKVYDLTTAEATAVGLQQGGFTSTIPTLEEFVAAADGLGVRLLVEVKPHGREAPGFAERVADELVRLDPEHRHWMQSLDADVVAGVEAADPERVTAFVVGLQLGDLPSTPADAIVIEDWSYSDAMLASARVLDQELLVWTIDDLALLEDYIGRGVDGVITDEVPVAVGVRTVADEITNDVSLYITRSLRVVAP